MSDPQPRFDPVLLSQVRLGVVAVLMTRPEASFNDLKSLLDLTQGNLGIHLQRLEEAGYVVIEKKFVHNKPRTNCRLSPEGRRAFLEHLEQLNTIARENGA